MSDATRPRPREIRSVLATDCGSTTTKAILIQKVGDEYRLIVRGEAPTTVEAPFEDVTRGVLNAILEVEELSGRRILDGERIIVPEEDGAGVDVFLSTSSAGGGLQMMVGGVVKAMSGESAQRAALGAGAIVMGVLASNDGRTADQKIRALRDLRPDMILLSGGIDGGTTSHVAELAELLAAANPAARLGAGYQLPVIYAGNVDARQIVRERLGAKTSLVVTDNIRPVLERENLAPARATIHDLFMEHVMAQAPGYRKLMTWTSLPIMPTPAAVGAIIQRVAARDRENIVGVDIGGATTDVFSDFGGVFNRTVSANLGMSYSVSNVLAEAGIENILRWVPFALDESALRDRIKNKMIRPTTIPQTREDLAVEQAIAREALRLAFEQHKSLAVGLKGVQQERTISDTFDQSASGESLVDLGALNLLIGSGGVLSHAPRRAQAAAMLIDAFLPEGLTRLAVDSIFMMPQLGVLASEYEKAATDVFEKDCLVPLGTCVAPVGAAKDGATALSISWAPRSEATSGAGARDAGAAPLPEREIAFGSIAVLPLGAGETVEATLRPAKSLDLGEGKGKPVRATLRGGVVGVIVDARGRRPFALPEDRARRVAKLAEWAAALGLGARN
ncbi:MAG: glutamate mutase L [bacterium]